MSKLSIVILNYRTPGLVIDCLRSLIPEVTALAPCPTVVVEGGSGDDSAQRIGEAIAKEGWGNWAQLLVLEKNIGFAGGNNAAIRPLLASADPPEYILLLNPDTVVRPNAVQALLRFMEENPTVGIGGSRLEDPDGTPQRSAFRFPGIRSEFEEGVRLGIISKLLKNALVAPPVDLRPHPTDWVAGASMMVRKAVFDRIGLMDDTYFLYYEETDFCLRAARAGFSCWYVPESRVVHLVGQATGVTNAKTVAKRRPKYWFESRSYYFKKNYGRIWKFFVDLVWTLGFASWRVRRVLQRKPDPDPPHMLSDFIRHNFLPF